MRTTSTFVFNDSSLRDSVLRNVLDSGYGDPGVIISGGSRTDYFPAKNGREVQVAVYESNPAFLMELHGLDGQFPDEILVRWCNDSGLFKKSGAEFYRLEDLEKLPDVYDFLTAHGYLIRTDFGGLSSNDALTSRMRSLKRPEHDGTIFSVNLTHYGAHPLAVKVVGESEEQLDKKLVDWLAQQNGVAQPLRLDPLVIARTM